MTARLEDADTELALSAASAWEIAIKWAIGRLALPEHPETYVPDRMARSAVTALPITHAHALATAALPLHHNDPFDRLLLAQAITDGLSLVTADPLMRAYDAEVIWIGTA